MLATATSLSQLHFFCCYGAPLILHSFPTRRSSDLKFFLEHESVAQTHNCAERSLRTAVNGARSPLPIVVRKRSEEHTSELQSRFDVVCRLLLEKKKRHY